MTTEKTEPPRETITRSIGPQPEGLTEQALEAQCAVAPDVESAPDPAATSRRRRVRKSAKRGES